MLTCGLVILNYNNYALTEGLLDRLKDCSEIEHIVVVDNNSPNDSYTILKLHESSRISVIESGKNGGYSYGNNVGAKYLIEHYSPDIICIANPDVVFDDSLVRKIKELFALHSDYALITGAGTYRDSDGEYVYSNLWGEEHGTASFRLKSVVKSLLRPFKTIVRKLLRLPKPSKSQPYIENVMNSPEKLCQVWAVCGCLFFIRTEDFVKIGMFDENVFMYCEEVILAKKLQRIGKKTGVTKEAGFIHEHIHPDSPVKKLESSHQEAMLTCDSNIYYFGHYLTDNRLLLLVYTLLKKTEKLKIHLIYLLKRALLATSRNT